MKFSGLLPVPCEAVPHPYPGVRRDFTLWKHQVRAALRQLCALDFPRGVPAQQATDAGFRAAMQRIYIESRFPAFVACQAWQQAGLSQAAGAALRTLQQRLDAYDEPGTDMAIVADPAWWVVLGQALLAVRLLG